MQNKTGATDPPEQAAPPVVAHNATPNVDATMAEDKEPSPYTQPDDTPAGTNGPASGRQPARKTRRQADAPWHTPLPGLRTEAHSASTPTHQQPEQNNSESWQKPRRLRPRAAYLHAKGCRRALGRQKRLQTFDQNWSPTINCSHLIQNQHSPYQI